MTDDLGATAGDTYPTSAADAVAPPSLPVGPPPPAPPAFDARAPAFDAIPGFDAAGAAPPPPAYGAIPGFDAAPAVPAPPEFDAAAPAPAAWEPPVQPEPRMVDASRPWGLADPGPMLDGTWQSPGYGSSATRANALRVVLVVAVASNIASLVLQAQTVSMLAQVKAGDVTVAEIAPTLGLLGIAGLVGIVAAVALVVSLIAWTGRVVDNIPPLTGRTPERSPQLAMWSWVIPVANYALPYMVVRDALWRLRRTPDEGVPAWLLPWWLVRVVGAVAGFVVGFTARQAEPTQLIATQAVIVLVSAVASIGDFAVVTAITRRENAQAANLGLLGGSGRRWPAFVPGWGGASSDADDDEFIDDDPLSRQPGESAADHEERLLAVLEAEAVRR